MKRLAALVVAGSLLAGCQIVAMPVGGAIYGDVEWAMDTPTGAIGSKTGSSECMSILGLIAVGDASTQAAARNGGITKISTVEHHSTNILGIYGKFVTRVTGE
jgi:hypothetical protein